MSSRTEEFLDEMEMMIWEEDGREEPSWDEEDDSEGWDQMRLPRTDF